MEIDITFKNYRCFSDQKPLKITLENGLIAFIGPNNSGKTSVLKFFYEFRQHFMSALNFHDNPIKLPNRLNGIELNGVIDRNEIFHDLNRRELEINLVFKDIKSENKDFINSLSFVLDRNRIYDTTIYYGIDGERIVGNLQNLGNGNLIKQPEGKKLYSAALENALKILTNSIYIGAFRNAISESNGNYYGLNIGTAFVSAWSAWKSGNNRDSGTKTQKVIEDIRRIFGFERLDVDASDDKKCLKIFINGKPYGLNEVGGGLAQFIIVLGNVALSNPSFVFIDEPELNLHPSLQLDFLTSIASYTSHGVIFSTHSVGLARSGADKIYSVKKEKGESIVKLFDQQSNLVELLGEMSFSTYQEIGLESILLVEGKTDIKVQQQLLRLLGKEHKVLIISLDGERMINASRIDELKELQRITKNIFILIDSEKEDRAQPVLERISKFEIACRESGFNILIMERRAIENYFTSESIQNEKQSNKYKALGYYEKLSNLEFGWSKSDNWRIARFMTLDELKLTDVGKFLLEI